MPYRSTPADGVQRLKHRDPVTHFRELRGAGESRRADPTTAIFSSRRSVTTAAVKADASFIVRHEPLQLADGDRGQLLPHNAERLTLRLLRTDTPADGGEIIGFPDLLHRPDIVLLEDKRHKPRMSMPTGQPSVQYGSLHSRQR